METPNVKESLEDLYSKLKKGLNYEDQLATLRLRMAADYFNARTEYEYLDSQAKEAKAKMDSLAYDLANLMEKIGDGHFFKSGIRVGTRNHFGLSVTQENSDAWRGWLSDKFGDDEPFLKKVVDKPSLQDRVREALSAGDLTPDDIPEWANLRIEPIITLSGWKK